MVVCFPVVGILFIVSWGFLYTCDTVYLSYLERLELLAPIDSVFGLPAPRYLAIREVAVLDADEGRLQESSMQQ